MSTVLSYSIKWQSGASALCSVVSHSLGPHSPHSTRLLCPWNFPGNNTGVGSHFLLQGIFPTQGSDGFLASPALTDEFFTYWATWEALWKQNICQESIIQCLVEKVVMHKVSLLNPILSQFHFQKKYTMQRAKTYTRSRDQGPKSHVSLSLDPSLRLLISQREHDELHISNL